MADIYRQLLTQGIKVNINSSKRTYQYYVPPDTIHWERHITSVIFLPQIYNLSLTMRKHQTNPNQGTFCKLQLFEHHKIKIQPTEREKIFGNDIYDKGLTSKIYRELMQLNNKKKTNKQKQFKNWAENRNRHFFKEDIQMAKRYRKRWSTSWSWNGNSKTTMKYYFTPIRMVIAKKKKKDNKRMWRKGNHCW